MLAGLFPVVLLGLLIDAKPFPVAGQRARRQAEGSAAACHKKVYLTAPSGTLSSPNYPNLYPPNSTCTWIIKGQAGQVIRIKFLSLDVKSGSNCGLKTCKCDQIHLREPGIAGPARIKDTYCNAVKPFGVLTTVGHRLRVVFRSDSSREGKGFYMRYEILQNQSSTTALPPPINATQTSNSNSSVLERTTTSSRAFSRVKGSFVADDRNEPTDEATPTSTVKTIPHPSMIEPIAAKRKDPVDRVQTPSAANTKYNANNRTASGGGTEKEEEGPPDIVILGPSLISVLAFVSGVLGIAYHNYRENEKEKHRYERYERLPYRRPVTGAVVGRKNSKKKQKRNMREIRTHKLYSDMAREWKDQVNIPPRKQSNEQSTWNSYMEAKRKRSLSGRLRELAEKPVHFIQTHTPRPSRPQSMIDPDKNAIPLESMAAKQKSGFLDPGTSTSRPASVLLRDALHMIFAAGLPESQENREVEAERQPLVQRSGAKETCNNHDEEKPGTETNGPMTIPSIVIRQPSLDSEQSQTLESPVGEMSERPPKYEDITRPQQRDLTTANLATEVTITVEDEPSIPEEKSISLPNVRDNGSNRDQEFENGFANDPQRSSSGHDGGASSQESTNYKTNTDGASTSDEKRSNSKGFVNYSQRPKSFHGFNTRYRCSICDGKKAQKMTDFHEGKRLAINPRFTIFDDSTYNLRRCYEDPCYGITANADSAIDQECKYDYDQEFSNDDRNTTYYDECVNRSSSTSYHQYFVCKESDAVHSVTYENRSSSPDVQATTNFRAKTNFQESVSDLGGSSLDGTDIKNERFPKGQGITQCYSIVDCSETTVSQEPVTDFGCASLNGTYTNNEGSAKDRGITMCHSPSDYPEATSGKESAYEGISSYRGSTTDLSCTSLSGNCTNNERSTKGRGVTKCHSTTDYPGKTTGKESFTEGVYNSQGYFTDFSCISLATIQGITKCYSISSYSEATTSKETVTKEEIADCQGSTSTPSEGFMKCSSTDDYSEVISDDVMSRRESRDLSVIYPLMVIKLSNV